MKKISEFKTNNLIYNHIVYDQETERHLAMHSHALIEFIYILKGEVAYTVENKKFTARQGELLLIKPYSYHYFTIQNKQDYEKIGILCDFKNANIDDIIPQSFILVQCSNGRIHDIFHKIDFYYHNCPKETFQDLLQALSKEIFINLQLFSKQYVLTAPADSIHPLIEQALHYINENLFTFNTVKELSRALSVSESYLKTLFANQLKVTPKNYITAKKMLFAKSMITNGTPPTQAAFHCGYNNYATFYRIYLRYHNTNPMTDYRTDK